MTRDYRTLDAIVVCACLVMIAGAGWALVYVTIPQANLPIFASLISGSVCGALGLYTGARWGNKKPTGEDPLTATVTAPAGGSVSATLDPTPPAKS